MAISTIPGPIDKLLMRVQLEKVVDAQFGLGLDILRERDGEVHDWIEGFAFGLASHARYSRLDLALKYVHDDGSVPEQVILPAATGYRL